MDWAAHLQWEDRMAALEPAAIHIQDGLAHESAAADEEASDSSGPSSMPMLWQSDGTHDSMPGLRSDSSSDGAVSPLRSYSSSDTSYCTPPGTWAPEWDDLDAVPFSLSSASASESENHASASENHDSYHANVVLETDWWDDDWMEEID